MHTSNYERFKAFYSTPSFWLGKLASVKQFPLSVFDFSHLKDDTASLELPSIPPNTVLGKRAEYFYQFCIEQSNNYDLIVANLQIQKEKRTLGELDYIIKEKASGKLLHVELVYKFYCYDPDTNASATQLDSELSDELSKYVGPNKRDNFVYKFDRLVNHQLPLLYHDCTRAQLEPYHINVDQLEQRVCFLAHVFIPQAMWNHDFKYIHKKCIAGYYLNIDAFKKQYVDEDIASAKAKPPQPYYLPEKYAWKMKPHAYGEPHNYQEVVSIASASLERGFAPLVWQEVSPNSFQSFFIIK